MAAARARMLWERWQAGNGPWVVLAAGVTGGTVMGSTVLAPSHSMTEQIGLGVVGGVLGGLAGIGVALTWPVLVPIVAISAASTAARRYRIVPNE